jgi:signal peptidase I
LSHYSKGFLRHFETFVETHLDTAHSVKCLLAADILRTFGNFRMKATGWSMMPALWPGDILEIESVGSKFVSLGDVILFIREGRLFAHRVVSKVEDCHGNFSFTTQGDAMPEPDLPISETAFLGKVCRIDRGKDVSQPGTSFDLARPMLAAVLRHSVLTSRVLARLHNVRQIFRERTNPCQS